MMKRYMALILVTACLIIALLAPQVGRAGSRRRSKAMATERPAGQKVRFAPLHIYLDSGSQPLAAFQFELKATAGQIKIVGVEGGQHKAFKQPPYYDPAALANNRIIIAAFNTAHDLPSGRTRIATIHLQILGGLEPDYELKLTVAADADGREIPAKITFEKGAQK